MPRSNYLILFVTAFLMAIFASDLWNKSAYLQLFALLLGLGLFIRRVRLNLTVVILIVLAFLFGNWRFSHSIENVGFEEGYKSLEGCVVEEVDVRSDKVKYVIDVEGLARVLVNGMRYPLYEYGDCLKVSGRLARPEKIEDFDYDEYLARYNIYALMSQVRIEKVSDGGGSLFGVLYFLKGIYESRMGEIFAEPHNSFMAGLILGSRKGIPQHLMTNFNTTGLTHIIAISGYNITLVIVFVGSVFAFLSRRKKVLASIVFIFLFVVLVGASAAVVRAGIMGSISLVAVWFGREYRVEIALLLAAFLMALWNPKIIVYDVGFQLSFMATMGLIFVSPKIEKYFLWLPENFAVRESVLMTMSAQVLALPVIVYDFGRLSLISPVANLFVLPFIPLAMMFGFAAVALSFVSRGLAMLFGFGGYLILEIIVFLVKVFAKIPAASVDVQWFSWWMVLGYYYFVGREIFKPDK